MLSIYFEYLPQNGGSFRTLYYSWPNGVDCVSGDYGYFRYVGNGSAQSSEGLHTIDTPQWYNQDQFRKMVRNHDDILKAAPVLRNWIYSFNRHRFSSNAENKVRHLGLLGKQFRFLHNSCNSGPWCWHQRRSETNSTSAVCWHVFTWRQGVVKTFNGEPSYTVLFGGYALG